MHSILENKELMLMIGDLAILFAVILNNRAHKKTHAKVDAVKDLLKNGPTDGLV